MKKNYYNNFFARHYQNRYPYRKPYENFAEIPVFPIMHYQESFFPVMHENTLSDNELEFRNYNELDINYNMDIYGAMDCEESFFQNRKDFHFPQIGPSITAMPTIIDFEEED